MAKQNENKPALTKDEISNAVLSGNFGEISEKLQKAERKATLTESYLDLEVGEVKRGIIYGLETRTIEEDSEEKNVDCVLFIDENGKRFFGFQTVLVSNISKFKDNLPLAVEITRLDDKKAAKGTYQNFDIYVLKI